MSQLNIKVNPIKYRLEQENQNQYRYWLTYKKASKQFLIDSVDGITKENIIKDLKVVKNAIAFQKDNILYVKHYDTIIFAFDLMKKSIIEMYGNCSQTSNRQLYFICKYLDEHNLIDKEQSDYFWNQQTKSEPTTRGQKNQFWDSEYGGGF